MNRKKNIQDELNELNSGLPSDSPGAPYGIPEGYFEGLADSIMSRIKDEAQTASEEIAALSPILSGISRSMPFAVPGGFFASNIENLGAITDNEESLVLSFVSKEGPYTVPSGYFEHFPEQVLRKVDGGAKVIPIVRRKWMRIAVAAMVTGIIALVGINSFNNSTDDAVTTEPVTAEIKKASTEELSAFIQTTDLEIPEGSNNTAQNTAEVKDLLKDVTDKELEAFLEDIPVEDEEFDLN